MRTLEVSFHCSITLSLLVSGRARLQIRVLQADIVAVRMIQRHIRKNKKIFNITIPIAQAIFLSKKNRNAAENCHWMLLPSYSGQRLLAAAGTDGQE